MWVGVIVNKKEKKRERTHGQDNSVVITGGGGWVDVETNNNLPFKSLSDSGNKIF